MVKQSPPSTKRSSASQPAASPSLKNPNWAFSKTSTLPGQRASVAYGWLRTGRTYERRDAYRRAILSATKQQVTTAIEKHLLTQKDKGTFVSFAGEELLKKGADQLPFAFPISPATKP